ncbi:hypothetical protein BU065_11990 [Staphylococcus succinus]|uniref:Uncharacterized protein n=2 Tax=Staphylococcus succinus TaxID=61015 RepID=A0A9Q6HLT2_9STAP|nr:hypothetical protein [Staphylococcus succinus]MEB8126766.1 hypothetical protein [Staphylococcus succinus]MEB8209176.1 hypothetical protein [Staphylococcus succinus]PTI42164.1 hypothetical protein BU062_06435 [Staphylococcus succinus]PTI74017.1 hypothetical protein BU058_12130 [Staphylococcus succinus]PTJ17963.1 hypothetical protein BU069_07280 [Staphylococcus succinus]
MKYLIAILIIICIASLFTLVKWMDDRLFVKRDSKSTKELRDDKKWLLISLIGGLIVGTLFVMIYYL